MNVILVGTGNAAFVLSQLLVAANHSIVEIVGRNSLALNQLSQLITVKTNTNFAEINTRADVCIITVSDSAIFKVASQLPLSKMLVVHTSGATSINALSRFENHGVMYPLQSLRKEQRPPLPTIPFYVDANHEKNIKLLWELSSSTGNVVNRAGDEERMKLHIAAVFSSNFTNHLYAQAEYYCKLEGIAFQNLLPLIEETANTPPILFTCPITNRTGGTK